MTKKKETETIGPLSINFMSGIRTDGQIIRIVLEQFDSEILLTVEQAISLVDVLERKLIKKEERY